MKKIAIKKRVIATLAVAAGLILFVFLFQKTQDTSNFLYHVSLAFAVLAVLYPFTKLTVKHKRKLSSNEESFALLSEVAKEGLLIHDQGIAYEINNALTKIIGYTRKEIIGKNVISSFVHPDDHSIVYQKMKTQNSEPYQVRVIKKDGTTTTVELQSFSTQLGSKTFRVVSIRDITEQKQIEERLKANHENFQNFFSTIDDMIFIADRHGKVFFVNEAVTRKLGYSFDELLEMDMLNVHPINKRKEARQIFSDMFEGKRDSCPLPLARKDGSLVPVETRIWFGKWNGKDCIFGISKDISREQEVLQKFNRMFNNNPALMAISDFNTHEFTEVNIAFKNRLGYKQEEIIGKTASDLNLFVDPQKQLQIQEELYRNNCFHNLELEVKTKDGEIVNGMFSGEIIENHGKKYLLTVMIDITDLKKIEEKLKNKRRRLESIITGTRSGTWEWNVQTGATIFNNRWAEMLGYSIDELKPTSVKTWEKLSHPEDLKKTVELLHMHFNGELPYYDCEFRMKHKNGEWIWVHDRGQVVSWTKDGKPLMMFGTHTDITERKQMEEQIKSYTAALENINKDLYNSSDMLEESLFEKEKLVEELTRAKKELEKINSEKDKFFSIIAHDLRSPFQSFIGLTETIAENINDFTLQELSGLMNDINSKAKNLYNLLKNLLEWAKMQMGVSTFDPQKINLSLFVEHNIDSVKTMAGRKEIRIINNVKDDLIILADKNMIGSVIGNLLTNAVKFTGKNGEIKISAKETPNKMVEISVSDTGIGMPKDIYENLFNLTEKVGRLGTDGEESTGLGLLLCKDFIERHKGKIYVESIEGKGSKFTFTMPLYSN